jgi:hypothetical protein
VAPRVASRATPAGRPTTTIVRRDEKGSGRFGSAGHFAAIVGQLRPATGHHDRLAGLQLTAGDAGGASAREGSNASVHGASRREVKASRLLGPNKDQHTAVVSTAVVTLILLLLLWNRNYFFINSAMDRGAARRVITKPR